MSCMTCGLHRMRFDRGLISPYIVTDNKTQVWLSFWKWCLDAMSCMTCGLHRLNLDRGVISPYFVTDNTTQVRPLVFYGTSTL